MRAHLGGGRPVAARRAQGGLGRELGERHRAHGPVLEHERARRVVDHRRGSVRGHHYGDAELAVCPKEQREEVLLGQRVEHARGLVEQKQARPHRERRREGEDLALAPGELRGARAKPRLDAEEVAGLGHAAAHLGLRDAEVLQAKGHLVPHRVADDLRVRVLEDVAHGADRGGRVELARVRPEDADCTVQSARGSDLGLGQAQKR